MLTSLAVQEVFSYSRAGIRGVLWPPPSRRSTDGGRDNQKVSWSRQDFFSFTST